MAKISNSLYPSEDYLDLTTQETAKAKFLPSFAFYWLEAKLPDKYSGSTQHKEFILGSLASCFKEGFTEVNRISQKTEVKVCKYLSDLKGFLEASYFIHVSPNM